jgi:hypothetical protein
MADDWRVEVKPNGRKAFHVHVAVHRKDGRKDQYVNDDTLGSVTFSVARKKHYWRCRQMWPVKRLPHLADELEQLREPHSEHALAKVQQVLEAYIASLRLGWRRPT